MKLYVTVVLLIMANILCGQISWSSTLPIRQSGDLEWNQSSVTSGGNDIVHVWSEKNYGVGRILVQKFYGDGTSLWDDEPFLLAGSYNNQWNAKITRTNDGGYVVAWLEQMNNQTVIKAQKLDFSGNKLWADAGVIIPAEYNEDFPHRLVLFPNENGGAIISWIDYDTMAQSLNSNGIPQWGHDGINVGYTSLNNQVSSDGHGGLIIVDTEEDSYIMNAKRLDSTGEVSWNVEIDLDLQVNDKRKLRIIYNNIDSYYVMTEDLDNQITQIAVRKLSLTGELSTSVNYIPLMNGTTQMYFLDYKTNVNGDLFLVSQSMFYYLDSYITMRAFKLDADLNHVWAESGVLLDSLEVLNFNFLEIDASDSGELYITNLTDSGAGPLAPEYNINLYKISAEGTIQTNDGGLVLTQIGDISSSLFLGYGGDNDNLFITWKELTEGYTNLRQIVLNDQFQSLLPEDSEIIGHSLTGYVYDNDYITYFLPESEKTVTIWLDKKNNMNNKIMYQIVNSDGDIELAENGSDIADFTLNETSDYEYNPYKITTAQNDLGQICVAWISEENGLFARSRVIDTDGSLLGSDFGEEIYSSTSYEKVYDLSMSSYNNDFYLSYMSSNYYGNDKAAYATRTDNNFAWGTPQLIDESTGSIFELNKVINNYCVVKKSNQLHYVYKIADDGSVSELNQVFMGYEYKFDCDADNNLFFTWYVGGEIYAQGITDSEQLYWNSPVQISFHSDSEVNVEAKYPEILVNDGINILWSQSTETSEIELKAQKLDFSGNKLWQEAGILLSTREEYFNVSLLEEMNDGYFIAGWKEPINGYWRYKLNIINSNGGVSFNGYSTHYDGIFLSNTTVKITNLQGYNLLFTSLYEGGLYARMNDFLSVDIESNETVAMTENLLQNYPNPFNPETNISFQVPNSGQVNLDIYNIKGQKVKTLVNDIFSAGRHSVVWNGRDDSNKEVASGLYLYKMRSGKYSSTKKMILMK